eukprot:814870-Pelagomonas_calceolata.AAC.7
MDDPRAAHGTAGVFDLKVWDQASATTNMLQTFTPPCVSKCHGVWISAYVLLSFTPGTTCQ